MKRKLVALLLMATMLTGIFAGCGQSGEQENENEQVSENEEPQGEEQGDPAKEEHDPVTLHYYFGSYAEQEDAQKVFAYANELIQEIYPWITVEFHVSATADYPTHMALAQANGDQIDIIGSYGLDYQVEMSNGSFMDITEYLSDYPDLMSALPDFAYGYGQKDGKTYGIPNWQQSNYANAAFAIEKETADALGFDVDKMNELIREYAEILAGIAGVSVRMEVDAASCTGSSQVQDSTLDSSKLEGLGWVPRIRMEEGLRGTLDALRSRDRAL